MACDRPLAALDSRPGPHLPTGQLPVSLASGAEVVAAGGQTLGKVSFKFQQVVNYGAGVGYIACDRPLAALIIRPWPNLPTGQLPVNLASGADVVAAGGQTLGKVCGCFTASQCLCG